MMTGYGESFRVGNTLKRPVKDYERCVSTPASLTPPISKTSCPEMSQFYLLRIDPEYIHMDRSEPGGTSGRHFISQITAVFNINRGGCDRD